MVYPSFREWQYSHALKTNDMRRAVTLSLRWRAIDIYLQRRVLKKAFANMSVNITKLTDVFTKVGRDVAKLAESMAKGARKL